MVIKVLKQDKVKYATELAWRVFLKYEAPEYSEEGTRNFYKAINDFNYLKMLKIYGAFEDERLVGVLSTRNDGEHIALFFVDEEYQGKGIGRLLFERAAKDNVSGKMTVNAAPYARDIYLKLGFKQTDDELLSDGIRYIPMLNNFKEN